MGLRQIASESAIIPPKKPVALIFSSPNLSLSPIRYNIIRHQSTPPPWADGVVTAALKSLSTGASAFRRQSF
jgi:hypothetical protein